MERHDSPSMLDALAAEAKEIMDLQAEASRISIEAVRKAGHLWQKLGAMAYQERHRAPLAAAEPKPAPVAPPCKPERALLLYSETELDPKAIAEQIGSTWGAVNEYLRAARKVSDPRAAQGDLRRQPTDPVPEPARQTLPLARPTEEIHKQPDYKASGPGAEVETANVPTMLDFPPAEVGRPLAEINLRDREITLDGNMVQIARAELRIVHLLNEQRPTKAADILKHVPILSLKSLRRDLAKLNPTLSAVGLTVFEDLDNVFQLRRLPAA